MEDYKGCLLLDALNMEVQGTKVDVITITSTLAPCTSISNASSSKHPLQSSILFAFQQASLKAAGVLDAIVEAGAACSVLLPYSA